MPNPIEEFIRQSLKDAAPGMFDRYATAASTVPEKKVMTPELIAVLQAMVPTTDETKRKIEYALRGIMIAEDRSPDVGFIIVLPASLLPTEMLPEFAKASSYVVDGSAFIINITEFGEQKWRWE